MAQREESRVASRQAPPCRTWAARLEWWIPGAARLKRAVVGRMRRAGDGGVLPHALISATVLCGSGEQDYLIWEWVRGY
jgi:hypothetical protein